MKSAFFLGALLALVITTQACVSIARAAACEVTIEDIGGRNYTRIFVGTGMAKRSATMEEVFDAMNAKDSTLFRDLKFVSGRVDQPLVYVEAPKESIYYDIRTLPKNGPDSPPCEMPKKGEPPINGYECRVKQLKSMPDTDGLPKGIKTGLAIAVPEGEAALLERISRNLGCDALYNVDGSSAMKSKGRPVPVDSPASGTGTKP